MGSAYSYTSSKLALAPVVAFAFLAFCYVRYAKQQAPKKPSISMRVPEGPKKTKRNKQTPNEESLENLHLQPTPLTPPTQHVAAPSPAVVPGSFAEDVDTDAALPKSKKPKKRKGKKTGAVVSSIPTPADDQSEGSSAAAESSKQSSGRKRQSANAEQNESWTRVEPRHHQKPLSTGGSKSTAELASDTGVTTSITDNSSPISEQTEDETDSGPTSENRRTLAERILPRPRKTGVEDMLETPDYPSVARVVRIHPRPGEKPAPGFTWADYEDVQVAADDADSEDDGGWGVVKPRGRSRPERSQQQEQERPVQSAPETKKQRQNAARREAQKAAKVNAEAERLATLAKHKKEQEKARIAQQYAQKPGKKAPASASVDDGGHLVWD